MARLDDRRLAGPGRHRDIGDLLEEGADGHRVGGVVGPLVDDLENILRPKDRRRHLNATRAPAIGHRHFARCEGNLIAGYRNGLQDRPADHPLGLLVEISKIVCGKVRHSAASFKRE